MTFKRGNGKLHHFFSNNRYMRLRNGKVVISHRPIYIDRGTHRDSNKSKRLISEKDIKAIISSNSRATSVEKPAFGANRKFVTSTPNKHGPDVEDLTSSLPDGALTPEQTGDYQSFVVTGRNLTVNKGNTPRNRKQFVKANSHECSLECYAFPDLSKSIIFEHGGDKPDSSSKDESLCQHEKRWLSDWPDWYDHAKWTWFHGRRRQWYLNRWSPTSSRKKHTR
eukprot:gene2755-975_t